MDQQALSAITVYHDLLTVLKERGYTDIEAAEIFAKLTAQAEMEVVEELLGKLNNDQLVALDVLPDNASASDIAQQLGLDGAEIDAIRAQKTAQLIEQMAPIIDQ